MVRAGGKDEGVASLAGRSHRGATDETRGGPDFLGGS